jgi:hypothetical protein
MTVYKDTASMDELLELLPKSRKRYLSGKVNPKNADEGKFKTLEFDEHTLCYSVCIDGEEVFSESGPYSLETTLEVYNET